MRHTDRLMSMSCSVACQPCQTAERFDCIEPVSDQGPVRQSPNQDIKSFCLDYHCTICRVNIVNSVFNTSQVEDIIRYKHAHSTSDDYFRHDITREVQHQILSEYLGTTSCPCLRFDPHCQGRHSLKYREHSTVDSLLIASYYNGGYLPGCEPTWLTPVCCPLRTYCIPWYRRISTKPRYYILNGYNLYEGLPPYTLCGLDGGISPQICDCCTVRTCDPEFCTCGVRNAFVVRSGCLRASAQSVRDVPAEALRSPIVPWDDSEGYTFCGHQTDYISPSGFPGFIGCSNAADECGCLFFYKDDTPHDTVGTIDRGPHQYRGLWLADYAYPDEYQDNYGGCVGAHMIRANTLRVHVSSSIDNLIIGDGVLTLPITGKNVRSDMLLRHTDSVIRAYEACHARSVTFFADELGNTGFNRLYKLTKRILQRRCNVYFVCDKPQRKLDESITNVVTSHPFCEQSNPVELYEEFDCGDTNHQEDVPDDYEAPPFDVAYAQAFVNDAYKSPCPDTSMDSWLLEQENYRPPGVYRYCAVKGIWHPPEWDYLTPILETPIPRPRRPLLTETLLSLGKRNLAKPELAGYVDHDLVSDHLLDSFISTYFPTGLDRTPVRIDEHLVAQWYHDTGTYNPELLLGDGPVLEDPCRYIFSLKCTNVKPDLTVDAPMKYQTLQTIVSQSKFMNAIMCPIFREMKRRVIQALRDGVYIFTDASIADLEDRITAWSPYGNNSFFLFVGDDLFFFDGCHLLEIDMSKFDKSQDRTAVLFTLKLMRYMGVHPDVIRIWDEAHKCASVADRSVGLKFDIVDQMRSGAANTLFGNTTFLMAVISLVYPVSDILNFGVPLPVIDPTNLLARTFNLEAKILNFKYGYFASRFVLYVSGRWHFVPDPLKLIVRLGRYDIVNEVHLKLVHVSFCDVTKVYRNYEVCVALALAVSERYRLSANYTVLFHSICALHDFEQFNKLWTIDPGANIDINRVYYDT